MLTPNKLQEILNKSAKAQEDYQKELIRIILEVGKELSIGEALSDLIEQKKKTDKKFIEAEQALQNAHQEIKSISAKF